MGRRSALHNTDSTITVVCANETVQTTRPGRVSATAIAAGQRGSVPSRRYSRQGRARASAESGATKTWISKTILNRVGVGGRRAGNLDHPASIPAQNPGYKPHLQIQPVHNATAIM